MKKIFYLFISLIVVTGCEATYNIDIDDAFNENLIITPKSAEELSRVSEDYFPYPSFYNPNYSEDDDYVEGFNSLPNNPDSNYNNDISKDEEDDNYITTPVERYNVYLGNVLSFSYKFGEKYQDSNIVITSTDEFVVVNAVDGNSYSRIYAKGFSKIFDEYNSLSKLTINVKTSRNVLSHNADLVNGNIYTWIITNKNSNRDINIVYSDDRYYANDDKTAPLPVPDDNPNVNPNPDVNPDKNSDNNKQSDNKKTSNKGLNEKQSKVVLYVLYSLFFGLIFVIIIFRKKFKK